MLANRMTVIDVKDAEQQFDIDEFNDLYARQKPTLYIKLPDIFAIHGLVSSEMASICPDRHDPLHDTLRELGSAKNNENDMMHVSTTEITLTLNPKYHDVEGRTQSSCSILAKLTHHRS
jgi:Ras GTPase-activating-like protein IQGAP2/3